jgi:ParB/RepB/Spo0J family partition protein
MSDVDKLQNAEEEVAQMREEAERAERERLRRDLAREPVRDTASKPHRRVEARLDQVQTLANMRAGDLDELHELAVSIRETGLINPPTVRATGDPDKPYELIAGRRRFEAMKLVEEVEGQRTWPLELIEGVDDREAFTLQFVENFQRSDPEPIQFARAARAIMSKDTALTAADVARMVGAPPGWARKALKLLDLPEQIQERVESGDLSFTAADFVRRGIAKGTVSEQEAVDLVERRVAGEIKDAELKESVGYKQAVKPDNYEEISRQLDEARWAAERGERVSAANDTFDEDEEVDFAAASPACAREVDDLPVPRADRDGVRPEDNAPLPDAPSQDGPGLVISPQRRRLTARQAYAYVIGRLLRDHASDELLAELGVDRNQTYRLGWELAEHDRGVVLERIAAEMLDADPQPPAVIFPASGAIPADLKVW